MPLRNSTIVLASKNCSKRHQRKYNEAERQAEENPDTRLAFQSPYHAVSRSSTKEVGIIITEDIMFIREEGRAQIGADSKKERRCPF